jgi:hypothetical protein
MWVVCQRMGCIEQELGFLWSADGVAPLNVMLYSQLMLLYCTVNFEHGRWVSGGVGSGVEVLSTVLCFTPAWH